MARFITVPIMIPSQEELLKIEKELKEKEETDRYYKEELGLNIESEETNLEIPLKRKEGIRINVDNINFYNKLSDEDVLVFFSADTLIVNIPIDEFDKLVNPVRETSSIFKTIIKWLKKLMFIQK
jgi:hypothetical protein